MEPKTLEGKFCSACGTRLLVSLLPPEPGQSTSEPAGPLVQAGDVMCVRCQGANPPHMRFCQFCGASLQADGLSPDSPQPAGEPAPVPVQVPTGSLIVIGQDGTPGRSYPIMDGRCEIGRAEGTIQLANDMYVSPLHARIVYRSGQFVVQDLDSVNHVFVRLTGPWQLQSGDLVLIGLEVLRFEVVSEAEQRLGPAADRGTQVFGSPAAPRHSRLCQRTVEGVTRDIFFLSRTETVIGREAGDIVFTSDPFMSRRHAAITRDPRTNTFTLRDLGSSNGTYIAIHGEHPLAQGDHVRIGQHLFRLEIEGGTDLR